MYDRWNSIPHYAQTEKYGRGPCEPSLTSYYAHHSRINHVTYMERQMDEQTGEVTK